MGERELQETQEKLGASERFVSELQQSLQQKDETIADLQQTISDHQRKIQQLETGDRDHPQQLPVTAPQTNVAAAKKDISKMRWREGKNAPEGMKRGASVVNGDTMYLSPSGTRKVYRYILKCSGE